MPIKNYTLVKGSLVDAVQGRVSNSQPNPHFQLHLHDGAADWRVAVNVQSKAFPSELLYYVDDDLEHALLPQLLALPQGGHPQPSAPGGLALDFLRQPIFPLAFLEALPFSLPGAADDLNELLDARLEAVRARPGATVYAWGETWDEPGKQDKIFRFPHGRGVHDVHMNQGNYGAFSQDDGVWQDGALLLHLPAVEGLPERWIGIFLVFQSQALRTDDAGHLLTPVSLVGARVNVPAGGRRTVTLYNASPDITDISGWLLRHRDEKLRIPVGTTIASDATITLDLPWRSDLDPTAGGYIRLLDNQGVRADAVTYTAEQAARLGWSIVF